MFEIFKEFRFDAAHALADTPQSGGRYGRLHGHSYRAQVFVRGGRGPDGWVMDLGALEADLDAIRALLDHHFLNEVPELGAPTLENLAHFIWSRLAAATPGLHKVVVRRDSTGEGCAYRGPDAGTGAMAQSGAALRA